MALTKAQLIALHEILAIPFTPITTGNDGYVDFLDPETHTRVEQWISPNDSDHQAKAVLVSLLTEIAGDSDLETALKVYLDRWNALGTQVWVLDGNVGNIQGIATSPEAERREIMRRVKITVPFVERIEEIKRQTQEANQGGGSMFIGVTF